MKLSVLLLSLILVSVAFAFTFNVEAHDENCFYEDIEVNTKVGVQFQVTAGGFLDIDFKILDPESRIIYTYDRETEGKFAFVAHSSGAHSFCFSNKMSTVTAKTVVFELNVGDAASKAGLAKATDIAYLDTAIYKLADSLNAISSEQHYLRNRERVHRNTTESTNARVLWWSFCEAAVLVAMSLWQIFYLKRFFEVKRVV